MVSRRIRCPPNRVEVRFYETECIHFEGPWAAVDDVELATLNWVWWFNNVRLHSAIGYVPPVEYEQAYYDHHTPNSSRWRDNPPSTEDGAIQAPTHTRT